MDLSHPDGTGTLTITGITIDDAGISYNFEGPIEGYGTAHITQYWRAVDAEKSRGTMEGEARILFDDGTLAASPLRGTFLRNGTRAKLYFTDSVSNGAMNFVSWDIDFIGKNVAVKYFSLNS